MPDNGCRRQQRYLLVALLLALPVFSSHSAQAGIFKCVAANGEITFSQTPCPKVKTEAPAQENTKEVSTDNDVAVPERSDGSNADEKITELTETAHSENLAQVTPPASVDTLVEPDKKPENPALLAQKRKSDARDEENRLQCENNIKSQINSINSQMGNNIQSSSLVESLQKKRRALEDRLNNC